ncbi:hypothetical protein [uncultured Zhongshania sp.]|uniref:hypothetical protein n=1 Tax=uncultured Zhongshania sp. TaxID=1642288 RepID=UPI0025E8538A|nr:hypothetical protein [uncultured Zhongshania sp.]
MASIKINHLIGDKGMCSDRFKEELSNRIERMCKASRDGYKTSPVERHRLEGFIQAGVFLGKISNQDARAMLEDIYFRVVGKSIAQAGEAESAAWPADMPDYSHFDTPTFIRK